MRDLWKRATLGARETGCLERIYMRWWMDVCSLNTKNTSIVSLEFKLPVARFSAENASVNKYDDAASRAFIDRILQANMRLLLVAYIH